MYNNVLKYFYCYQRLSFLLGRRTTLVQQYVIKYLLPFHITLPRATLRLPRQTVRNTYHIIMYETQRLFNVIDK
jgi:hypothetical protein